MVAIDYDMIVFKEDEAYVAYCPELDVSSCGNTVDHAKEMLKTAVRLFLEEAEKMGTLAEILEESRYTKDPSGRWLPPRLVATELVSVPYHKKQFEDCWDFPRFTLPCAHSCSSPKATPYNPAPRFCQNG